MADNKSTKLIAAHRQARHEYYVLESFEAGIELCGTEVKSLREGRVNLKDSYCSVKDGEVFAYNMHISAYEKGNIFNRDPLPEEQDACIKYLREQVKLIRPRIIVCLGRISAQRLISPDFKITRDHGKWTERAGVSMCAVYHPAALLRDPSKKGDMLDDMKSIKAKLAQLEED